MRGLVVLFVLSLFVLSCNQQNLKSGIDKKNFDTSVRPQDDFYRYVDGAWLKRITIPADKSNYGAFTKLYDESRKALREIIEEAAKGENQPGSDKQKVGDFYNSYMDSSRLETLGIKPIESILQKISVVQNHAQLTAVMADLKKIGVQAPFSMWVGQDGKHSDQYILYLSQSGLGLPDRDYYLRDSKRFNDIRQQYVQYMQKLFKLAGQPNADKRARRVLTMETSIAQKQWSRVQNRNRDKTYNRYAVQKLESLTPDFDWTSYLHQAGADKATDVIVRQPDYLTSFNKLFKRFSVDDWKTYLTLKTLSHFAGYLNHDFVQTSFDFYGKTLSGTPQMRPRWKRGVSVTEGALGEVLGRIYVQKHFKPAAKKRMKQLVNNLIAAYGERLKQVDWMSEPTKKEALKKLSKFTAKIGYPDKWRDYSGLEVKKDDLVGNIIRSDRFDYAYNLNKLGKPVDRGEWGMYPQTVNAYYNPSMNEVVFPAAILQPPFFNMEADEAVNYGGIGAVIGHELTHGFDDQGSKSDGDGNLRNWWTKEDRRRFEGLTQKLVKQYSSYVPIDTLHLNGKLTLGENIADLGGVTIAYEAYHRSLNGKPAPVIDGLSGDQRFFMGWAQVWKRKYRDSELRRRIFTDPHSPSEFRANGVLMNFSPFYKAFDVKPGDKMYKAPEERIVIW